LVRTVRAVVVDPSRVVLKCVSQLLAARKYDVRTFADGREARDYIAGDPDVSVLITSTEPLSISGAELCWEVRLLASGRRPIYVIVMSSNDDQRNLIEALDGGADDLISKPPAAEELYARLRCAERLTSMQRQLIRLATTDPLTGALNRRAFFETGHQMCEVAAAGEPLAAIMFDVDHFKRINDEHGHDIGDVALRQVVSTAGGQFAVLGRLGGEEFAVLLAGTDVAVAVTAAEALRTRIAALQIATPKGALSFTSSFGVAEWVGGDTIDSLLKRADTALYQAKHSGRNRVVAADSMRPIIGDDDACTVTRAHARG
jgi:two-component system cell cycle response regulator